MVNVTMYKHSKSLNSTALPQSSGVRGYSCSLKDSTSMYTPVLEFSEGNSFTPSQYNYIYIEDFERYYWIRDWSYSRGIWYADCAVDVLASFRAEIGASTQYVLRSSSNYDGGITDGRYPTTGPTWVITNTVNNPWASTLSGGSFVVGIINSDTGGYGAVNYYVFSQTQFKTLLGVLLGQSDWMTSGINEISADLVKALVNPIEYVTSCRWYPFSVPKSPIHFQPPLKFGWWELNASCSRIAETPVYTNTVSIKCEQHPQAARGTYLNISPYAEYYLDFRPFGQISLPPERIAGAENVYCTIRVDCVSGVGTLSVSSTSNTEQSQCVVVQSKIGVDIPIASIAQDYTPTKENLIARGASVFAGFVETHTALKSYMSAISGSPLQPTNSLSSRIAGAVRNGLDASTTRLTSTGGTGGFSDYSVSPKLQCEFWHTCDDEIARFGRPCCKVLEIDTLSGYVQCASPTINITGSAEEQSAILEYMQDGFYWE